MFRGDTSFVLSAYQSRDEIATTGGFLFVNQRLRSGFYQYSTEFQGEKVLQKAQSGSI